MPDLPTSEPESDFVCDCDEWFRSACAGGPFDEDREGKKYCVLHFPSQSKGKAFKKALERKLSKQDFDFKGVWFPEQLSLSEFEFTTRADFRFATFNARVDFSRASFKTEAYFSGATFNGTAYFIRTTFGKQAYFRFATFTLRADFRFAIFQTETDFRRATFGTAADFYCATFGATANFSCAVFENYLTFAASEKSVFDRKSSLNLRFARIEKPEHVCFHTLKLHPHWFVNVDAHRFDFINVHWANSGKAKPELERLRTKVNYPHRLLAIASRKLAANAEENDRYREASHFRRMALDAERLETWHGFDFRRLNWWYWVASGYGERPFQALIVLVAILVLFGALYTQVGFARWEPRLASEADAVVARKDNVGAPLKFSRALTYSAGVMALQRPEPKPATTAAQAAVLLETILGPVQGALLALAIRRKFMR